METLSTRELFEQMLLYLHEDAWTTIKALRAVLLTRPPDECRAALAQVVAHQFTHSELNWWSDLLGTFPMPMNRALMRVVNERRACFCAAHVCGDA